MSQDGSALHRLSKNHPVAAEAVARRQGAAIGGVHFGPGAFHRAHQADYFNALMATDRRWGLSAVALKTPGLRDALAPQDGLYVLAELEKERSFHVVGSILECLVATEHSQAVLDRMASPAIGWISATVTEKGYCLDGSGELDVRHPDIAHDLADPRNPLSLIGYLAEGLRLRRAAGLKPPVIVSCDNLADNGLLLRHAVVAFAGDQDRDLAQWIDGETAFPRTMVDSITPATDDALRALVAKEMGVIDAWPIQRERFVQWVIEDCLPAGSPDLASVGTELTGDVAAYEAAKLRLLNGAHSSLAYMGLLKGHETVAQAMADPELSSFVRRLMIEDIAPLVRRPASLDLDAYIAAVLARFENPAIRHNLAQIAWDGSKKLPFRLLSTVTDALAAGRSVKTLARPLAAWMRFIALRAKAGVEIVDPLADRLAQIGLACTGEASADVDRFLVLREVFPAALAGETRLRNALVEAYALTPQCF